MGTKNAAINPPENPLLYRFRPAWRYDRLETKAACKPPANKPTKNPNSPAKGAKVVEKNTVNIELTLDKSLPVIFNIKIDPNITGSTFLGCFPKDPKPITVNIAAMVGPFKFAPIISI